jgi:hypothetical protein
VCITGYRYAAVAAASASPKHTEFLAAGSVLITTCGIGATLFVSAAKPKSMAMSPTNVMRLMSITHVRGWVGVCEMVCAGAMAALEMP